MIGSQASLISLLVAALVLAIALLRWPGLGTLLAAALLYLNLLPIAMREHHIPPAIVALTAVIIVPPLVGHWLVNRAGLIVDRPFLLMLAFFVCAALSALVARDRQLSILWLTRYLLEGVAVYLLFANLVRSRRALAHVTWTILLCGAVLASLTLYQEMTRSYTNTFGGFASRASSAEGLLEDGSRGARTKIRAVHRAQGPSLDANRYAQILIVLLPLGWCLMKNGGVAARFVAGTCSLLIFGAVLLTYSRGAFVGILVLLGVMGLLRLVGARQALAGVLALAIVMAVVSPGYRARMDSLRGVGGLVDPGGGAVDPVARQRATLMLMAWKLFLEYPILGIGPGQFAGRYVMDYGGELYSMDRIDRHFRVHSLYLELAAETGVVGLSMFMMIVGSFVMRLLMARRWTRRIDPVIANYCAAFLVAIAGYLATAVFLHLTYQRYLWLLLALAGVTIRLAGSVVAEGRAREESRSDAL